MADKRIIELEERLTLSDGDYLATDNTNGTCKVNAKILLDRLSDNEDAIATKAAKVDLTNISITGSTNNTGSTITSGSFFYKNGTLVRAKTDIANNATLTLNTNYEIVTAGGLNALNNALTNSTTFSTDEKAVGMMGGQVLYEKTYAEYKNWGSTTSGQILLDSNFTGNLQFAYGVAALDIGSRIVLPFAEANHTVKIEKGISNNLYLYGTNMSSAYNGTYKVNVFYVK